MVLALLRSGASKEAEAGGGGGPKRKPGVRSWQGTIVFQMILPEELIKNYEKKKEF